MRNLNYIKPSTEIKRTANELKELFLSRGIYCKHNKNRIDNSGGYIISVLYNDRFYKYPINKTNYNHSTDYLVNQIISKIL